MGVGVSVGVRVGVGVSVGVSVGSGSGVFVGAGVSLGRGSGVFVSVAVGTGVSVGAWVDVAVDATGVSVAAGGTAVFVAVGLAVVEGVAEGVGVGVTGMSATNALRQPAPGWRSTGLQLASWLPPSSPMRALKRWSVETPGPVMVKGNVARTMSPVGPMSPTGSKQLMKASPVAALPSANGSFSGRAPLAVGQLKLLEAGSALVGAPAVSQVRS